MAQRTRVMPQAIMHNCHETAAMNLQGCRLVPNTAIRTSWCGQELWLQPMSYIGGLSSMCLGFIASALPSDTLPAHCALAGDLCDHVVKGQ